MALFISCVDGFVPWVGGGKEDLGPSFKLSTQEYKVGGTLGVISSREGFSRVSPLYLGFRSSFSPFFLQEFTGSEEAGLVSSREGGTGARRLCTQGRTKLDLSLGRKKGGDGPLPRIRSSSSLLSLSLLFLCPGWFLSLLLPLLLAGRPDLLGVLVLGKPLSLM